MKVKDIINRKRQENISQEQSVAEAYDRYGKMDEGDLVGELRRVAAAGRNDGSLTNEKLDSFVANAAQYMTPEQLQKMRLLVSELKK